MKNRRLMTWLRTQAVAAGLMAGWLWFGPACASGHAQEAPPSSSDSTHSVTLQYAEQSAPLMTGGLSLATQAAPFAKEPDFGKRQVVRSTLKSGTSTDHFLALVWDLSEHKLYLDLNRNQDLTDDGVLVSEDRSYGGNYYYQTFTNVLLSFKTPMGLHRMRADLHFQRYNQELNVTASVRSFWQAQISLQGKEWQIGFIERPLGKMGSTQGAYLLLRPWAQRQRAIDVEDGALEGFRFCTNLFFNQRAYQVECTYVQQAGAPGFNLELKEREAQLGELTLTGQFIQRLVLESAQGQPPFAVVLDNPGPVVRVPVGGYVPLIHLQQGGAEAHPETSGPALRSQGADIVVSATRAAVLADGGPLTNTVSVTRQGRELALGYQLLGAEGKSYQLLGPRTNPGFAIYQADKKLASGKFEFG